jgi:aldose 1-epimerase
VDPHQPIDISGDALRASITPYGGYLTRLRLGNGRDVVLAHADQYGREADEQHLGCLVGRVANRLRGGMFELDGWHHQVPCNATDSHLHGGITGFHRQVWTVADQGGRHLELRLVSPAGHENYPGTLTVTARFSVEGAATLRLSMHAETDAPTPCNLTFHPYFNLAGHAGGHVGAHRIAIDASRWLPMATDLCPTGDVVAVDDTPFDLREPRRMNTGMVSSHPQIKLAEMGYDHYFLVDGEGLRRAARVDSPDGRIGLELWTDQAGLQFYTGNTLNLLKGGKQEERYRRYDGFCLEPQAWPDAPNHHHFPNFILRPGESYDWVTEYRFTVTEQG